MKHTKHIVMFVMSSTLVLLAVSALVANTTDATNATAHRMGISVVHATFSSRGEVWNVSLKVSRDGETFGTANVGFPRPWQLFRSVSYNQDQTTVLIPVAAYFATNEKMLLFQDSGRHWFRVEVNFRDASKPRNAPFQVDETIEPVVIEQILDVREALQADLNFIRGLADPDLIRAMFGQNFFERQDPETRVHYRNNPDVLAVAVIGKFLEATRESDPTRVNLPRGDLRKAADLLWQLAQEIPESSYAPYAAYFAGCCYLSDVFEHMERFMRRDRPGKDEILPEELPAFRAHAQGLATFGLAGEALGFAAAHGDAYLKPWAIYMQAQHAIGGGLFDEAEAKLNEAEASMPGRGRIEEWAPKLRKSLRRLSSQSEERGAGNP